VCLPQALQGLAVQPNVQAPHTTPHPHHTHTTQLRLSWAQAAKLEGDSARHHALAASALRTTAPPPPYDLHHLHPGGEQPPPYDQHRMHPGQDQPPPLPMPQPGLGQEQQAEAMGLGAGTGGTRGTGRESPAPTHAGPSDLGQAPSAGAGAPGGGVRGGGGGWDDSPTRHRPVPGVSGPGGALPPHSPAPHAHGHAGSSEVPGAPRLLQDAWGDSPARPGGRGTTAPAASGGGMGSRAGSGGWGDAGLEGAPSPAPSPPPYLQPVHPLEAGGSPGGYAPHGRPPPAMDALSVRRRGLPVPLGLGQARAGALGAAWRGTLRLVRLASGLAAGMREAREAQARARAAEGRGGGGGAGGEAGGGQQLAAAFYPLQPAQLSPEEEQLQVCVGLGGGEVGWGRTRRVNPLPPPPEQLPSCSTLLSMSST
jgi:hypothetical protein